MASCFTISKDFKETENVYVKLLSELCGESYFTVNSRNLLLCEHYHESRGFTWKTIYFALLEYNAWLDKQYAEDPEKEEFDKYLRSQWDFRGNRYDPFNEKLEELLLTVSKREFNYMTAEEFRCKNII